MSVLQQGNISRAYATLSRSFRTSAARCAAAQQSMHLVTKPCPPSPAWQEPADIKPVLPSFSQVEAPVAPAVADVLSTPADHYANVMSQVQEHVEVRFSSNIFSSYLYTSVQFIFSLIFSRQPSRALLHLFLPSILNSWPASSTTAPRLSRPSSALSSPT